jgi:hypothetical protein
MVYNIATRSSNMKLFMAVIYTALLYPRAIVTAGNIHPSISLGKESEVS